MESNIIIKSNNFEQEVIETSNSQLALVVYWADKVR